jgi:hypothetical protein
MAKKIRTGRKVTKPIPTENLSEIPYGDQFCHICTSPNEMFKDIHRLRYEEKYTYMRIREYLKEHYRKNITLNAFVEHFRRHVVDEKQSVHKTNEANNGVITIDTRRLIEMTKNDQLESAYVSLANLARLIVGKTAELSDEMISSIDTVKLMEKIKTMDGLTVLEKLAKISKEARELVSAVTTLRAPHIIVTQFLEKTIYEITQKTSEVLAKVLVDVKNSCIKQIKKEYPIISQEAVNLALVDVFRRATEHYQMNIKIVHRDMMSKIQKNLSDLEKIV